MSAGPVNVAVLGSTGSIGVSALEVIAASQGRLKAIALAGRRRCRELLAQAQAVRPRWVVVTDEQAAKAQDWSELPSGTELVCGEAGLARVVAAAEVEVVLAAIVGSAGLSSTWAALEAGKRVALANKETLVVGGPLVMELAARSGATILPVDSEHSAVFQAAQAGRRSEIRRVVLTASGGPFLRHTHEQLIRVSVADALAHPTWNMGPKITVDSATMMNKALEIIEARWLFDLAPEQIEAVIHPQSIVHSLVEFVDGSVVAQLSPPDMKLPIQYALTHPERWDGPARRFDWSAAYSLDFEPPNPDQFPALALGHEVAKAGGTAGAVLNAANEAAVAAFLAGRLPFLSIVPACRDVLAAHAYNSRPGLEELLLLDRWARQEIEKWLS